MKTCRKCGVTLADYAHHCMQCGTPDHEPSGVQPRASSALVQPSLIGGAAIGILSSLPFINLGNCICCMWVVGGGALASWLLIRQNPSASVSINYGDGAFVGVLSGVVGAMISTLFSLPFRLLTANALRSQQEAFEEVMNEYPAMEGAIRELLLRLVSPEISFVTLMVTFFTNLLVFSLFAMIGGILMVALLKEGKVRLRL